jgi:hypothetical protein
MPQGRAERRLVVTVCPREPGVVTLPLERGGRAERMSAAIILARLRALVAARGLGGRIRFREGCAGGCTSAGPNVSVEVFPVTPPGERPDHVAIGWRTYVYSLPALTCLAAVIDENLGAARARPRRAGPRARRPRPRAWSASRRSPWRRA